MSALYPAVGQRVMIEGVEHVITRIKTERSRAQIDLIPVEDAKRRITDLTALLEGKAKPVDE